MATAYSRDNETDVRHGHSILTWEREQPLGMATAWPRGNGPQYKHTYSPTQSVGGPGDAAQQTTDFLTLCNAARACTRTLALPSSSCLESLQPPPTASAAPRRPARPPFSEAEAECKRGRKEDNSELLTTCTQSGVRASLRAHVLPGPLSQGNLHRTPANLSLGSSHLSPLRLLSLFFPGD